MSLTLPAWAEEDAQRYQAWQAWTLKIVQRYQVVDMDEPTNGIESELTKITFNKKEHSLGNTDENGYYNQQIECKNGEKIKIDPTSKSYFQTTEKCPIKEPIFKVQRVEYVISLAEGARLLEKSGDIGTAALVYNELAARSRLLEKSGDIETAVPVYAPWSHPYDLETIKNAEQKVYELTAKTLNVQQATEYDPLQKKNVPSEELIDAVKGFQRQKNLNITGEIDYKTLSAASGKDINQFIYSNPNDL